MSRKRKKTATVRRSRDRPHTFYFSEQESEQLKEKAAARGCSMSDLVRHWANLAPRKRKAEAPPPAADPRQMSIAHALEPGALTRWVEGVLAEPTKHTDEQVRAARVAREEVL